MRLRVSLAASVLSQSRMSRLPGLLSVAIRRDRSPRLRPVRFTGSSGLLIATSLLQCKIVYGSAQ